MFRSALRLLVLSTSLVAADTVFAGAIVISEVMSSGGTSDWFELTNTTGAAISLSGFKMDDNSFSLGSSVALTGISTLAPFESVVFLQAGTSVSAFRAFWGGTALTAQIGTYADSSTGLGSGGDGVIVFNGTGTEVTRVSFGAATTNVSFGYNPALLPNQSGFGALSVDGVNGAFTSNTGANIGSPGAVPEPSGAILLLVGAGTFLTRPRRTRGFVSASA